MLNITEKLRKNHKKLRANISKELDNHHLAYKKMLDKTGPHELGTKREICKASVFNAINSLYDYIIELVADREHLIVQNDTRNKRKL